MYPPSRITEGTADQPPDRLRAQPEPPLQPPLSTERLFLAQDAVVEHRLAQEAKPGEVLAPEQAITGSALIELGPRVGGAAGTRGEAP